MIMQSILDNAPRKEDNYIMTPRKQKAFSDQLREAIRISDSSCYAIHKATGIDQAVLSKFLSGERGMLMPSIDALVEFLNLELIERKRP